MIYNECIKKMIGNVLFSVYKVNSKSKKLLQKFRVPLGFLFGVVVFVFASPTPIFLTIGAAIIVFGLLIRAWASGHIRKNQRLTISGPYEFTRNPLYLGSFLLGLGFMVASAVWWLGLLFIILFLSVYFPVMDVEANELTRIFGNEYKEYERKVPLFFPRLSKFKLSEKRFEMGLYMRYREYRAALGSLFTWTILAIKVFFN